MTSDPDFDIAYPEKLREKERELLEARRAAAHCPPPRDEPRDRVGFALSGGGIRSATFCLGLFQALAAEGLLRRIDYISSVSGGGYFATFLGRLFGRSYVGEPKDVEKILRGKERPEVLRWLREHGRYLAPNGAGELLVGGAILLRNWAALHIVLATFVLTLLFLVELVVRTCQWSVASLPPPWPDWLGGLASRPALGLWWSPLLLAPAALFVFRVVPHGWAYWMIERRRGLWLPVWGLLAAFILGLLLLLAGVRRAIFDPLPATIAGAVILATVVFTAMSFQAAGSFRVLRTRFARRRARDQVSVRLSSALVWTFSLFVFALLDTLGHSLYAFLRKEAHWPVGLGILGTLPFLATVTTVMRRAVVLFGGEVGGKRLRLRAGVLAHAAAVVLVAIVLVFYSVLAHAICVEFDARLPAPTGIGAWHATTAEDLVVPGAAFLVFLVFSLLFGSSWTFLNRSSQLFLYRSRLVRAYLGASNSVRRDPRSSSIIQVVEHEDAERSDDVNLQGYWRREVTKRGAPLHLINVTVNETVGSGSKIQQQDRKGIGMALGPCGFSAGVRHHAVFDWQAPTSLPEIYPQAPGSTPFRMFGEPLPGLFHEQLALGSWVGISGAAFSTGLGSRTNLGLSLLCGLGNVRLGFWWEPRVKRLEDSKRRIGRLTRFLLRFFSTQTYILSEFVSRFPGPAWPRWYLSDGGHFENLGGYGLVRRRIERVVVIDAEADDDYTYEGLANLVRKARLDFGAEIEFLSEKELDAKVHPRLRQHFGTLEQLRRGTWKDEPVMEKGKFSERKALDEPESRKLSMVHAALARVRYAVGGECELLYIKPALTGDEPTDVLRYHAEHSSFPHESTADQFFDEAQWESYRRLGEHIGELLFAEPPAARGRGPAAENEKQEKGWTPRRCLEGMGRVEGR